MAGPPGGYAVGMEQPTPPMQPSNEATSEQLEITRTEGRAYHRALRAMAEESGAQTREAGDYLVAVVVEEAEGMYAPIGGHLVWHEPVDANAHVEVAVADRQDGRFVPGLDVTAEVVTAGGTSIGTRRMPFLWHPFLYHYGHNWRVPSEGDYTVKVRIDVPEFHRHDPVNGRRYAAPVDVEFGKVHIRPGIKRSATDAPRRPPEGAAAG